MKERDMRFVMFMLGVLLVTPCSAYDPKKDPLYKTAYKEANSLLGRYYARCGDKNYVRFGRSSFYEFNGGPPKARVLSVFEVSESERLNGLLWKGNWDANLGTAARSIFVNAQGVKEVSKWTEAREVEFGLMLESGEWKLKSRGVLAYVNSWIDLSPGVSCADVPS